MSIQDEKQALDDTLYELAVYLGITPKEARGRIGEACDRTRKFYLTFLRDYEIAVAERNPDMIRQKLDRLKRLKLEERCNE